MDNIIIFRLELPEQTLEAIRIKQDQESLPSEFINQAIIEKLNKCITLPA